MPDEPDRSTDSADDSATGKVTRGIVQVYANLYGRGAERTRSYVTDDYVLCVLEELFTEAERTMMKAGKSDTVHESRTAFQDAVRKEFVSAVEEATGREVRSFQSQIDVENEIAIELFLLAPRD